MGKVSKITCVKCNNSKNENSFYISKSPLHNGRNPICKLCIRKQINLDDIGSVKNILRMLDRPFMADLWNSAINEGIQKNKDVFGIYMKNIGMKQFFNKTWVDSEFGEGANAIIEANEKATKPPQKIENLDELKEKFGFGYEDTDYLLFEKKYQQLRPSFQLVTTMHEECLREYCVNKVKETLAKAVGNIREAKDWAALAKDTAEAGKLKPSQMSKADLAQGLDGFGQLARMVEERVDILPILPKFVQQPKDKVDIVLWLYVNYVRDLKGLPEADYKDIYEFYEIRRADYEKQELDNDPSMRSEE